MDTYALHLAVAALFGASVVAMSAYYTHRKTLTQLLEFAKTVDKDREKDHVSAGDSPQHFKRRRSRPRRKGSGCYRRDSASLPDVMPISGGQDGEDKPNMLVNAIPDGLPTLHMLHEGMASLE